MEPQKQNLLKRSFAERKSFTQKLFFPLFMFFSFSFLIFFFHFFDGFLAESSFHKNSIKKNSYPDICCTRNEILMTWRMSADPRVPAVVIPRLSLAFNSNSQSDAIYIFHRSGSNISRTTINLRQEFEVAFLDDARVSMIATSDELFA